MANKLFRITYRMEVYVEANSENEAVEKFESMDEDELCTLSNYVERVSIDEEDEVEEERLTPEEEETLRNIVSNQKKK